MCQTITFAYIELIFSNYTLEAVTNADNNNQISDSLKKATDEGKINNTFIPESKSDDQEKVNYHNLTDAQETELSQFAVRLVNEVRQQVGTSSVSTDSTVQSLANAVADQYKADNWEYSKGHDVPALDRVLMASQNAYAEDMAARYGENFDHGKPKTMSDMKFLVYDSITDYLFIGTEYHHAGSIVGDNTDLGLSRLAVSYSYSKPEDIYYDHFIFIP